MPVFGRRSTDDESTSQTASTDDTAVAAGGKGRATPSRRDAQEARKQQLRVPRDPKQAKRAARERDRQARAEQRRGMMSGDPRYLPARDQGEVRAFARDYVDARFTLAEFFVFVAIGVLLLGFVDQSNLVLQGIITYGFFAFTAVMAVDVIVAVLQLKSAAKRQFPNESQKGLGWYAALRIIQLRRLRLPAPRVRRGGKPKQ